jgi:site-specific DNA recombinase
MKRTSKSAPATDPAPKQAVIYARVSSKEQEKEGFSIPAQLKLLKEYAAANGFAVAQEYIDVETAKQTGRTAFGEMVAYLKAHPSVRVMLVEKTDRLYRNLKDWVTVDELDVEMHFPKEGVVLSRESRSSEKFMHGIKVLMAKNYIDNLSEEARKGMQEKAEQGIWPTKTPLGYRNVTGPDGKKIIATDEAIAPMIAKLFEWYARGDISLKEAARKAHAAGLAYPKSGAKVPVSTVHTILRNRLYTGWFEWNGKLIQGKHEALVPVELWERVQGVLDGRFARRPSAAGTGLRLLGPDRLRRLRLRGGRRDQEAALRLLSLHRLRGISARATRPPAAASMCARKRSKRSSPNCSGGCVRRRGAGMGARRAARQPRRRTPRARGGDQAASGRIQASQDRIHAMYVDKLDGLVDTAFFDRMSNQWREEQNRAASARSNGTRTPTNPIWTKASRSSNSPATPKGCSQSRNRAKNAACSTSCYRTALWEDGEVVATEFRQPFDMLAETATAAAASRRVRRPNRPKVRFGWGTWIRTKTNRVRVCCATVAICRMRNDGRPRNHPKNIWYTKVFSV